MKEQAPIKTYWPPQRSCPARWVVSRTLHPLSDGISFCKRCVVFFVVPFFLLNATRLVPLGVPFVDEPAVVALGAPSSFILLVLAFVAGHGAFGFFHVDGFFQSFDHISRHFVTFLDIYDPGHFSAPLSGSTFSFSFSSCSGSAHDSD